LKGLINGLRAAPFVDSDIKERDKEEDRNVIGRNKYRGKREEGEEKTRNYRKSERIGGEEKDKTKATKRKKRDQRNN
jgi:hypothetical protein